MNIPFIDFDSLLGYLLLARLESAYSLIRGAHRIWGQGGGEPLTIL